MIPRLISGWPKQRRLRRDPHVAAHRQLAAAAERDRVDRRDRDDARGCSISRSSACAPPMNARPVRLVELRERLDVGARAEHLRVGRHDDQRADRAAVADVLPDAPEVARRPSATARSSAGCRATRSRCRRASRASPSRPARSRRCRGACRRRSPGPAFSAGAALVGEPAQQQRRREALAPLRRRRSRAARTTSSRPVASARANGGGIRPAPAIIPRSRSLVETTPSSTSRHASTSALRLKRSASSCGSGVGVARELRRRRCGRSPRRRSSRRACPRRRARAGRRGRTCGRGTTRRRYSATCRTVSSPSRSASWNGPHRRGLRLGDGRRRSP